MGPAWRWVAAVASGVVVFEGLDALAIRPSAVAWLTLASPVIAGAVAGWGAGGGPATQLLAAGAVAWGRIGADRAVGLLHGVRQPLEVELAVAAIFGLPWMVMGVAGSAALALVGRLRAR